MFSRCGSATAAVAGPQLILSHPGGTSPLVMDTSQSIADLLRKVEGTSPIDIFADQHPLWQPTCLDASCFRLHGL